ncbi:unnamed protein product, partial [marine sediment metagenome]
LWERGYVYSYDKYDLLYDLTCFIVIDVYNKKFHCPIKSKPKHNSNKIYIDHAVKKRIVNDIYECIPAEKGISEIIFSYVWTYIKKEFITWLPIPEKLSVQLDELIPRILEII